MAFKNIWTMLCLAVIAINVTNAASAASGGAGAPDTGELRSLSCISTCSRLILEAEFDPSKNKVVAGDQVLMMLNILAALPGDNPLRHELEIQRILVDGEVFNLYNNLSNWRKVVKTHTVVLLPKELDARLVIPERVRQYGGDIQLILEEGLSAKNVALINETARNITKGNISSVVTPTELSSNKFIAIGVSYFNPSLINPFNEEVVAPFTTPSGSKLTTYLTGIMDCKYKKDSAGEIIALPLLAGAEFVIFKPFSAGQLPIQICLEMLEDLLPAKLELKLPKLSMVSNLGLDTLATSVFSGLGKSFINNLFPLNWHQSIMLETTTVERESSAYIVDTLMCKAKKVIIDYPFSFAVIMKTPDNVKTPLIMGYIGDPTLS